MGIDPIHSSSTVKGSTLSYRHSFGRGELNPHLQGQSLICRNTLHHTEKWDKEYSKLSAYVLQTLPAALALIPLNSRGGVQAPFHPCKATSTCRVDRLRTCTMSSSQMRRATTYPTTLYMYKIKKPPYWGGHICSNLNSSIFNA